MNEIPTCPTCGGEATHLGSLGRLEWFRCRACGMDFSRESETYADRQRRAERLLYETPDPEPLHPSDRKRRT